jgi:hypothetical protein
MFGTALGISRSKAFARSPATTLGVERQTDLRLSLSEKLFFDKLAYCLYSLRISPNLALRLPRLCQLRKSLARLLREEAKQITFELSLAQISSAVDIALCLRNYR